MPLTVANAVFFDAAALTRLDKKLNILKDQVIFYDDAILPESRLMDLLRQEQAAYFGYAEQRAQVMGLVSDKIN